MSEAGGEAKCGRCGQPVYAAEQVIEGGQSWHKRGCFTCKSCNKSLDSNTVAVHRDNDSVEIFCKSCYGRDYGPKTYGTS